jgi:single-strand DNA-binding protein
MAVIMGNLTRDPEMRYTPQGHAVTSFSVATNRRWASEGSEREETEFHHIVAWNKLAELCANLLKKGSRVYVQGRLQTRNWQGSDGVKHTRTEIVAEDMVVLDGKKTGGEKETQYKKEESGENVETVPTPKESETISEDISAEEIPF